MTDENVAARALQATRSNLVSFPVIAVCAFVAGIVVARTLSVSEFAVYALALALRGTVQFLTDFGTGAASARAFALLEANRRRPAALQLYARLAVARAAAAALLACGVIVFADQVVAYLKLGDEGRESLVWLATMAAAEVMGGLGIYALTGMLRQRWLNLVLIGYNIMQPLAVIYAAATGLGLRGVLAALALASVAKMVALHVGAQRVLYGLEADGEDGSRIGRSMTKTAGAASVGKLAAWVHSRPALSFFALPAAGRADFAVFALGYDLAHQAMALAAAPAGNVVPAVAAKTAHDRQRLRRSIAPVVISLLTAAAGFALVLAVTMAVLDGVLYGPEYREMGRYVAILAPMLVMEIGLATPATAILVADDRLLGRFTVVRSVELAAAALYLFIGLEDLLAATIVMAAVRSATSLILMLVAEAAVGPLLPHRWMARFVAVAALAAAAGIGAALAPLPDIPRGVGGGLIAAGAFVLLVRRMGLLGHAELELAERVIPAARPLLAWLASGVRSGRGVVRTG